MTRPAPRLCGHPLWSLVADGLPIASCTLDPGHGTDWHNDHRTGSTWRDNEPAPTTRPIPIPAPAVAPPPWPGDRHEIRDAVATTLGRAADIRHITARADLREQLRQAELRAELLRRQVADLEVERDALRDVGLDYARERDDARGLLARALDLAESESGAAVRRTAAAILRREADQP